MGPNCRQRLGPRVSVLREEHMHRFVADQRHREHHGLQSLAIYRKNGQSSTVTAQTRASTLANVRRLLRTALDTGRADRLDLDRDSSSPRRIQPTRDRAPAARSPTMWPRRWPTRRTWRGWPRSTTATTSGCATSGSDATGRRLGEVVNLRLDCTSLYNGLPMLWHDQTKVGNYDETIRIPDTVHQLLAQRRSKTIRKIRSIIVLLIFIFEALIDLARLGRRMK